MGPTDTAFDRGSFAMLEKIAATLGRMDAHLGLIRDASMISFVALAKQSKGDMDGVDVDAMVETADVCFFVLVLFLDSSIDFGDVDRLFDTEERPLYFKLLCSCTGRY
jgi:hypothetical protein